MVNFMGFTPRKFENCAQPNDLVVEIKLNAVDKSKG